MKQDDPFIAIKKKLIEIKSFKIFNYFFSLNGRIFRRAGRKVLPRVGNTDRFIKRALDALSTYFKGAHK
jgi:hypothetical protein